MFSFWSNENGFSFWQNEKLSEMLSKIRKRLQSSLACIFALRIFDKGGKMAAAQRSAGRRKNSQDSPRKPKKNVNVWESPFGKMMVILGEHCSRKIISIACHGVSVPFSVVQMIVTNTLPQNEVTPFLKTKSCHLYTFSDELLRMTTSCSRLFELF